MSMALKYGMNKRKKMADGGEVTEEERKRAMDLRQANPRTGPGKRPNPINPLDMIKPTPEDASKILKPYAEGGIVKSPNGDDDYTIADPVPMAEKSCIKKSRYAHGGLVERILDRRGSGPGLPSAKPHGADPTEDDFDVLDEADDLDFSYTGANSGDKDDDAAEDKDRKDIVSRIMRSRSPKKDRMPRPM